MEKKNLKKLLWLVPVALIIGLIWFVWPRLPIITAYAAKGMCSSVFLAEKLPERVEAEDLSFFPISFADNTVNYQEKSVTSTVFGLAKRKAIFREGAGAVIVLRSPEEELRRSGFTLPEPGYSQDTIPWPKGDVLSDSLPDGVDYARLNEFLDTCFDAPGAEPSKKTLGIALVYDGELIAERYLGGYDFNTLFHGWSMTKSVTGAWAGLLSDRGMLKLTDPSGIEDWQDDRRQKITLQNVMQMCSGLDWYENYFTISDATIMLMRREDMLSAVTDNKLACPPGTHWNYSSGDANLLSGIIRQKINDDKEYHTAVYRDLLYRMGMLNTQLETDASGLFVASSYSYGSTRDWARFGLFFLNKGVFAGDTILSESWVNFMRTPAAPSGGKYAGTFWLKESKDENALTDVPEDIFFADGFLGQRIYIIPSKKLVAVRMGYGHSNFSFNNFLKEVIGTLPE
ncbi:MAG TPA: serine hydrolase [Tangfeifania sp.]|nr:serine hydrolase [Tangfeifania sp.]